MNNTKYIILGIIMFLVAQASVWYQLNLQFLNDWVKNNKWAMALLGFPISYLYLYATEWTVKGFDGELWPGRLIGFACGMITLVKDVQVTTYRLTSFIQHVHTTGLLLRLKI